MPNYSGANARFGFAKETTKNTRVAATKWHPFVTETMKTNHEPIFSDEIVDSEPFVRQPLPGVQKPGGTIAMELTAEVISSLFDLALGGKATTGGPTDYTHTLARSLGSLGSFTSHLIRPGLTTLEAWEYIGCMMAGWNMQITPGRRVMWGMDVLANRADISATGIAPTFPTFNRFTPAHAALTVGGTGLTFDSLSIGAKTGVTAENQISSTNPGSQSVDETGTGSDVTGQFALDYTSTTESYYSDQLAGTTRLLSLALTISAVISVTISGDIAFTGDPTPTIGSKGKTKMQVPFRFLSGGSNEFTVVIKDQEATI